MFSFIVRSAVGQCRSQMLSSKCLFSTQCKQLSIKSFERNNLLKTIQSLCMVRSLSLSSQLNNGYIWMRGLPYKTKQDQVHAFLDGVAVSQEPDSVRFELNHEGFRSGVAFVKLESSDEIGLALAKNRHYMGPRYIEVAECGADDFESSIYKFTRTPEMIESDELTVFLRGLPFNVTIQEIVDFFEGLQIEHNGINLHRDRTNRLNGKAIVKLTSAGDAEKALGYHRKYIGNRYIEVIPIAEINASM